MGTDAVEHTRFLESITRSNGRLKERLFTPEELASCSKDLDLAVIFSVKESVAKALGTGFDKDLSWQDITVVRTGDSFSVKLSGRADALAGDRDLLISTASSGARSITCALLAERS